jgi:CHAT domain-containing protein
VTADELRRTSHSLKNILRTVPADSRAAAVLRVFQGLAALGLSDYGLLFSITEGIQPDDEALGIALRALRGEARYRMGRYEDGYLDLLRAESRAVAVLGRRNADRSTWLRAEHDGLARLAQKAGNALLAIGDEQKADEAFTRARDWLPDDPLLKAIDLINRGNLQFLRNALDRDQGYITVDRVLQKRIADEGPAALLEEKLKRHVESLGKAEKAYREALATLPAGNTELRALCHLNLGNLAWAWAKVVASEGAARLGALPATSGLESELVSKDSDARACLQAAIAEYDAVVAATRDARSGEERVLLASALGNLSEVEYLAAGPGDQAALRRALRAAEAALAKSRSQARRKKSPAEAGGLTAVPAPTLHPELAWQATLNVARIKQALGDMDGAGLAYRQAVAAVEALRVGLRLDAWQALFLRDKMEVYEGYLGFLFDRGGQDCVNAMFDVIEKTRARAFLDLLARARVGAALPPELRESVDDLLGRIAACNEGLRRATLGDDEKEAAKLLRDQQRYALEWADLQAKMVEAQAQDEQLNPPLITLAETQARLGPDRVLLLYQLGERDSHLLAITADAARAFRLPPRRTIELAALPVLFDCSFGDDRAVGRFREKNGALSRHLLGPLDEMGGAAAIAQDRHVLVAADGILHYLPFEALLPDPTAVDLLPPTATYADLKNQYLISRADVSYVPSASAWRELSDRPKSAPASSMLAVYDIRYDTGGLEPPLWAYPILMKLESVPGASDIRKAIDFVKTAWAGLNVVQIRGRREDQTPEDPSWQPTEQNFLRIAPEAAARFVVFNGHAMYNDKHPSLSGLVFNLKPPAEPDAADIPSDNFLRVDELFRLELPGAEVTFLAACQTALGAPYRGEGLNALLRAFMYRGSPAVVATLWAVDANAASWLLRRFFKLLADSASAGTATDPARLFSQAKRASIGFDNRWLPFHWAPFIYAGGTR